MKKICLITQIPSHYRKLIYQFLDHQFNCKFIFGQNNSTVKSLDTSLYRDVTEIPCKSIGNGRWYIMPGAIHSIRKSDVVINDMGILCVSSWLLLIYSKITHQRVYLWDHGWYGREGFVKKWVKRIYFGLADGAFIYGNYARNLMVKNGFDGNKLYVIHNSLDYASQILLRKSLAISKLYQEHFGNNNPVLCFIGRLTPVKKLNLILEAVHHLKMKGENFNIIYIGDGEMMNSLRAEAEELHLLNNVWFYGACYDEKTNAELLYNADICVAPGNIGLTAMHTMMFGCPCISHNDFPWQMPEFEAIKEGVTGSFFKHNDVESLADTISHWFSLHANDREDVRKACYKEIDENWTPEYQINVIKDVIYGKH